KDGKYYIPIPFSDSSSKRANQVNSEDIASHGSYLYDAPEVRANQEMQIIKGHPSAGKTFVVSQENIRYHNGVIPTPDREEPKYSAVPSSLADPMINSEKTMVDSRALLAYCDATLKKLNDLERRTIERFKAKLEAVEATLLVR